MPSGTFLRLSDVNVICRITYFEFPIQSAFLPYIGRQTAPTLRRTIGFNTQYRTSDVVITEITQHCQMLQSGMLLRQSRTLLRHCCRLATMSKQRSTLLPNGNNGERVFSWNFVLSTKSKQLKMFNYIFKYIFNSICFDFVERIVDCSIRQCVFDIVASVDGALLCSIST